MPAPTIDPLPAAPSRLSAPATFNNTADAFVAALPDMVDQINAVALFLSSLESGTLSLLLAAIDAAGSGANKLPYYTGSNTVALADFTALGRTLAALASTAAGRTALGLVIGTDVQAFSTKLAAVAANTVTTDATTARTAAIADADTFVRFTSASAVTFTIPPNSLVAFPVGTVIEFSQSGAGAVSVAAGAGVTVNSRSSDLTLAGQYAVAFVKKVAADTWIMNGDL